MNGRFVFGIVIVLVLIVGLIGVGVYAYDLGVGQGLAQSGKLVAPTGGSVPVPYYAPVGPFFYRPFGWGFGFLGCLFPLLFFFLIFSLFRGFWWRGPGWGGRYGPWTNGVPPRFEEWHQRAHEGSPASSGTGQSSSK